MIFEVNSSPFAGTIAVFVQDHGDLSCRVFIKKLVDFGDDIANGFASLPCS